MVKVAVMGYGTIGAGTVEVLQTNHDVIAKRAGEEIEVKYILDLREFPGDPNENLVIHDFEQILQDDEIKVVVECMGGLHPAYDFSKRALEAGKSVVTSNKEVVADYGAQLIGIADKMQVNYLFEASVGGGIPIIRPLTQCLTADVIENIFGILNGTTNYMLTKMEEDGISFDAALKQAQDKGYAELHPEADIEGYDPCRKIAILSSLAISQQVDYREIHTEGITNITGDDIKYAKMMGKSIKLLGMSNNDNGTIYAIVAPEMIDKHHPLAGVRDAFNAVYVHGNMVDDTMFYGQGAGSLPTASAVAGDVVDCVKHLGKHVYINWDPKKSELGDWRNIRSKFFVRVAEDKTDREIRDAFGNISYVSIGLPEKAFVTEEITEGAYLEGEQKLGDVIGKIRVH
ncbi:MAG: homoserine dehydrogenase [Lachnospiraceae bacterium]|nr:homoserine dehydrogenase [Lachnospiraceae bacterium]